MKKFTNNINENINHYAGDMKLYNEIYNMIQESLSPKMDGEDSEKVSIIGKDDLVKELSKLVENQITKSKIKVLESFKSNPTIIQEKIETKNDLYSLVLETNNSDPRDGTSNFNNFDGDAELEYINSKDTLIQKAGIVTTRTTGRKFPSTSYRSGIGAVGSRPRTTYSFQFEEDVEKFENYLNEQSIKYEKSEGKNDNWVKNFTIYEETFGEDSNEKTWGTILNHEKPLK